MSRRSEVAAKACPRTWLRDRLSIQFLPFRAALALDGCVTLLSSVTDDDVHTQET